MPSPQPKLPSQHSLQKQGSSTTDNTQVAQLPTANGVAAQERPEDEDGRSPERGSAVSTPIPEDAMDSSLTNGEGDSTRRESLQSVTACEEEMLNSCHRTPSSDTLLPPENETLEINSNVKEEPAEESSKRDQPVETKVKREMVKFLIYTTFCISSTFLFTKILVSRNRSKTENILVIFPLRKDEKKNLLAFSYILPSFALLLILLDLSPLVIWGLKKRETQICVPVNTMLQLCQPTRDTC